MDRFSIQIGYSDGPNGESCLFWDVFQEGDVRKVVGRIAVPDVEYFRTFQDEETARKMLRQLYFSHACTALREVRRARSPYSKAYDPLLRFRWGRVQDGKRSVVVFPDDSGFDAETFLVILVYDKEELWKN